MTMQLIEYGPPIIIDLELPMVDKIEKASSLWRKKLKLKKEPIIIKKVTQGRFSIRARGIAGFVRIGNKTLEIAPKFLNQDTMGPNWKSAMWRFLMYGRGVEVIGQTSGKAGIESGIADLLAKMFLSSLQGAAAKGYPLGYKEKKISSTFVKGRLDPKEYSRLLPFTGKIGVVTSQLTKDTSTNRLLKWAGLELARTVESTELRKQLRNWASELQDVSHIPPRIEHVPSPRHQYPHLVNPVDIATILLDDREVGFDSGVLTLPGFLWDSDDLFERATRRLLSDGARPLGLTTSKRTYKLAQSDDSYTNTTPDIDISCKEGSVLIADSKYKNKGKNPSNEDFYQVLAAGRVRGVETVALLYPAMGLGLCQKKYKPEGVGLPQTVLTLTIGLQSFSSKLELRKLKQDISGWIEINSMIPTQ